MAATHYNNYGTKAKQKIIEYPNQTLLKLSIISREIWNRLWYCEMGVKGASLSLQACKMVMAENCQTFQK